MTLVSKNLVKKARGGKREGAGRPKIELDPALAERMGGALPSLRDLATMYGVDEKTVAARMQDQQEFASAFMRGGAISRLRLSATQFEQACGYWCCPACNRPLRVPDPTPEDPERVKPCPEHDAEYFGTYSGGSKDGKAVPWRRWRAGNPISGIWLGKQHLGQSDRSFLEQDFQRDLSKIPTDRLLDLVMEAFKVLGKTPPAELEAEIQKGSKP